MLNASRPLAAVAGLGIPVLAEAPAVVGLPPWIGPVLAGFAVSLVVFFIQRAINSIDRRIDVFDQRLRCIETTSAATHAAAVALARDEARKDAP